MNKQQALLQALKRNKKGLTVIQVWQQVGASQL